MLLVLAECLKSGASLVLIIQLSGNHIDSLIVVLKFRLLFHR
jgi:hypothetical protein